MTTESQNKRIRAYLYGGGRLTPMDALKKFGCFRLSGRIHDIIKGNSVAPLAIEKNMIEVDGKRVAEYYWRAK